MSTSGVGTQARWLINGLIATNKYSFKVFGGAIKHDNYETVVINDDFVIKPTDGFGNQNMLRQALATEKPDAVLLFTDPRFFIWVWEMEDEVHQICPIAYNHLWDNDPWPEFNRVLYESTDLINCINWPTYEMVSKRFPEKTNYIPHALPKDVFFKLSDDEIKKFKKIVLGPEREDHFVVLFVSRNAKRKQPSDVIVSFAQFLEKLQAEHGHKKATLLMHTDPFDVEGPNLVHVVEMLGVTNNVVFSNNRIGFQEMNGIYNISDLVINISSNEGFGLSILEAKMAQKPVVAIKTGGLTRQVLDHETNEEFGCALSPDVRSLVGNQLVPYIYEDYVSRETVSEAIMKMYNVGPDERLRIGQRSRAHALKNYDIDDLIKSWDLSLTNLIETWKEKHTSWRVVSL